MLPWILGGGLLWLIYSKMSSAAPAVGLITATPKAGAPSNGSAFNSYVTSIDTLYVQETSGAISLTAWVAAIANMVGSANADTAAGNMSAADVAALNALIGAYTPTS